MAEIKRVDHIAIAVRDIDESIPKMEKALGAKLIARMVTRISGTPVATAYLRLGESILVLDQSTREGDFIDKFLEKRGEGLHHLGLEVDDLDGFVADLEEKEVRIPYRETLGDMRREVLLSPKDCCGVVMQVMEWEGGADLDFEARLERLKKFISNPPQ
jgi:methylmalonyl-CoA epimerase